MKLVRGALLESLKLIYPQANLWEMDLDLEPALLKGATPPLLILVIIGMDWKKGIEAVRRLSSEVPGASLLVLTDQRGAPYERDLAQAGVKRQMPLRRAHSDLVPLIEHLLETGPSLSSAAAGG
jgi:DNA-binding NarL/FixJ family response regulator